MARLRHAFLLAAALAVAPAWAQQPPEPPPLSEAEKQAERSARLQIASTALDKLYKLHPDAQAAVEKSAGYAVFDVTSVYAVLVVGQRGKGVLFDNATKTPVYMVSTRAGTGPGVGFQRVYQVFVFKAKGAMEQFMLAQGTGGDVGASATVGTEGLVRSFNPLIEIYQIPESGAAVQASWGGTVYTVDPQLK
jgi:lipid-binding SYLF domain-containing protein